VIYLINVEKTILPKPNGKRKWILIPSTTEKPIMKGLARTFKEKDKVKVEVFSNDVIINYGSNEQLKEFIETIKSKFNQWLMNINESDDIYVMLIGGVFQSVAFCKMLDVMGIDYKMLVYEKKLGRFVIIDYDGVKIEVK